jgi:hypothetical protein
MQIKELSRDQKKLLLSSAVHQLKKEFIGIDGIIDEIADCILPWWLFPHHQLRPLIINLWGMTGSGKTALIKRLTELLAYNNMLMRFDMGEFGSSSSFLKYTLTRQLSQYSGSAPIVVLDEFQFAKTKDESGKEVNNYNLRIIWDLLDSGELTYEPDGVGYYTSRAKKIVLILKALEKQGLTISNGLVTKKAQEAHDALTNYMFGYQDGMVDRIANPNPFKPEEILISDIFCTGIHEMNSNDHEGWKGVAEKVKEFTRIGELIDYIVDIYEEETSFKSMDLRKALIFVVGNLDEAFVMSSNINPDIDADEFQRYTQKITIADIKKALQSRFRNEQIARLGNTHLIYHAFSHRNFEQLITMHLDKLSVLVKDKFKLKTKFTKNINKLLYVEGVFPTQGVRPVISTIRNMIESNIAKVILHNEEQAKLADNIVWDFEDDFYVIDFFAKKEHVTQLRLPVLQKINSLRKSTHNDLQALVAVHEAGHAIMAMYLIGIVPEYVITKTVDTDSQGFTYTLLPEEIVTYRLLLDKIRLFLGGYVAEAHVYGKDHNTTGVSDDLRQVTNFAQSIFRDYGMHGLPARHNIHVYGGNPYQFTFDSGMEAECKVIVESCLADAVECIQKYEEVFLEISYYLSDHSRIDKPDLMRLAEDIHKRNRWPAPVWKDKNSYYNFREKLFLRKKKK